MVLENYIFEKFKYKIQNTKYKRQKTKDKRQKTKDKKGPLISQIDTNFNLSVPQILCRIDLIISVNQCNPWIDFLTKKSNCTLL